MWMKILGSALVTVSCSGLGMWKAEQWKEHRKMLEQIRKMILLLKGEILYAHAPLGEALEHVGRKSEGAPVCQCTFGVGAVECGTKFVGCP